MKTFYTRSLFAGMAFAALSSVTIAAAQPAEACIAENTAETTVEYAEGFTIEYVEGFKVIEVLTPWQGAEDPIRYVLAPCGADIPGDYADATVINVPIQSVVSMSTTYLPALIELDLIESVIGVDEFDYVYAPAIRERIDAGDLIEIGGGSTVNVEQALDLAPDLILTYGLGFPDYDAHPVLIEAGLSVALNGDYMETSPLGRAEWIKFIAAFFNKEAEADAIFNEIAANYEELAALAADAEAQPTVMVNAMYADTWYVSGGGSYLARLIEDAGGDFLWADDEGTGALPLAFEDVLDRAQDADVWLNPNFWFSLEEGLAEDERYAEFAAFENGGVYNNNARVGELGANDYTEGGALHADRVLADLIAILHPELVPDHDLFYFRALE